MARPQKLTEDGDAFEKREAVWLKDHLPGYEKTWQAVVGNDGNNQPLAIAGLSPDNTKRRKIFYQSHYSLALTCFLLDRVTMKIEAAAGDHLGVDAYLRDSEDFTLFIAYVGHVVDMARDIGAQRTLNHSEIYVPFDQFYGLRSHALHAARMPLRLDREGLKIPPITCREKKDGEWNDDALWEEADPKKFVIMSKFCREIREMIFRTVRHAMPMMMDKAVARFGQLEQPAVPAVHTFTSNGSNFSVYDDPRAIAARSAAAAADLARRASVSGGGTGR